MSNSGPSSGGMQQMPHVGGVRPGPWLTAKPSREDGSGWSQYGSSACMCSWLGEKLYQKPQQRG